MKKIACCIALLLPVVGCKKTPSPQTAATPVASAVQPTASVPAAAAPASELHPSLQGISYQLSLKAGVFAFCDDAGPQRIDLATGKQTPGTQTCDRKKEQIQSSCDDNAVTTPADGPADTIDLGKNTYHLTGHVRDCDQDGDVAIVSTEDVEVIDSANNKLAVIATPAPDKVVIGSGWVAWNAMGKPPVLRLETVGKALEHATTPKQ